MRKPRRADLQKVEDFNSRHPIGTPVRYWTGFRKGEEGKLSRTRTEAQLNAANTPVLWVEGHGSCIALTHIEAVTS